MNKIILASSSPRRKELLQREGIDFIIDASSIDEVLDLSLDIPERIKKLAIDKATPIHQKYPDDIVIGADTVVCLNNEIIGKASDAHHAKKILTKLSNNTHIVYTGVAIYNKNELVSFVEETKVTFKDITNMIDDYIESNEWVGKAGAYGIQGPADIFVDHTEGDIDSVIGLPVKRVIKVIKEKMK